MNSFVRFVLTCYISVSKSSIFLHYSSELNQRYNSHLYHIAYLLTKEGWF